MPRNLYSSAIETFTRSNPKMEQLFIRVHRDAECWSQPQHLSWVSDYLTVFPWAHIQDLTVWFGGESVLITHDVMHYLSTLPQLSKLDLRGMEWNGNWKSNPVHSERFNIKGFSVLQTVVLCGRGIPLTLQYFSKTNKVATVSCLEVVAGELQEVVCAIGMHCDPLSLAVLTVETGFSTFRVREGLDAPADQINIDPLLEFRLKFLDIRVSKPIQVSPAQVEHLCVSWRSATHIHLDNQWPTTSNPSIDHSHILSIAKNCPLLAHLGLRFDASRVSNATIPKSNHTQLRALYVGDSPIYSAAAVRQFLSAAFPSLEAVGYRSDCQWDIPIYKSRWQAVTAEYAAIPDAR
ncbi:hypothetical protein NMY22_g14660 [Coprinellus aureogranulatus]|nr:hypothetical protein NMY22_g14660 [Coprinellus aureogranulatus]